MENNTLHVCVWIWRKFDKNLNAFFSPKNRLRHNCINFKLMLQNSTVFNIFQHSFNFRCCCSFTQFSNIHKLSNIHAVLKVLFEIENIHTILLWNDEETLCLTIYGQFFSQQNRFFIKKFNFDHRIPKKFSSFTILHCGKENWILKKKRKNEAKKRKNEKKTTQNPSHFSPSNLLKEIHFDRQINGQQLFQELNYLYNSRYHIIGTF